MTIREYFDRKKRRTMIIAYGGFAGFAGGIFLTSLIGPYALLLALPSFAVVFVTMGIALTFGFRCPRCAGPWQGLIMQTGKAIFRLDPRIRFCPYCGVDIDAKDSVEPTLEAADLLA